MIPDVERAVVGFLLDDAALTAVIGENKVSTELPPAAVFPRVRVTMTGGRVVVQRWLYAQRITIEGWADTKQDAYEATVTALDSLQEGLVTAQVAEGVVTSCDLDTGLLWAPDPETRKPRYLGSVTIHIHPNP
jgi:hypothetical protein